jgi:hypothetical protein
MNSTPRMIPAIPLLVLIGIAALPGAQVVLMESPIRVPDPHSFSRCPLAETTGSIDCVGQPDARRERVLLWMLNLAPNIDRDSAGRLHWRRCLLNLAPRSSAPSHRNQEQDCQERSHSVLTPHAQRSSSPMSGVQTQSSREQICAPLIRCIASLARGVLILDLQFREHLLSQDTIDVIQCSIKDLLLRRAERGWVPGVWIAHAGEAHRLNSQ